MFAVQSRIYDFRNKVSVSHKHPYESGWQKKKEFTGKHLHQTWLSKKAICICYNRIVPSYVWNSINTCSSYLIGLVRDLLNTQVSCKPVSYVNAYIVAQILYLLFCFKTQSFFQASLMNLVWNLSSKFIYTNKIVIVPS